MLKIFQKSKTYSKIPHQILEGITWHVRKQPARHKFSYPYRYWGINLTALAETKTTKKAKGTKNRKHANPLPTVKGLFAGGQMALHEFRPSDYLT